MKKKKILTAAMICSIILYPTANATAATKKNENTNSIEKFIEIYNENADKNKNETIENTATADLQDRDYRTEFRLSAFKDATGIKGEIGNSEILIVNYGIFNPDSLRIYIAPEANCDIKYLAKDIIHALDNTITDQEIDEQLDKSSLYLGDTGYITGYVTSDDIMIDCTELNFN